MAKLSVKYLRSPYSWPPAGKRQRIGYNRFIEREGLILSCYHHRARVVEFDWRCRTVTITPRGYCTASTRNAINDFLNALSIPHRVSFANGRNTIGPYEFESIIVLEVY